MSDPIALSLGQEFELERMTRAIDATCDPQALRGLAKQLLQAWHSQKAATQWIMRQHLGAPSQLQGAMGLDNQAALSSPAAGPDGLEPGSL
jgi:hypothetical protein